MGIDKNEDIERDSIFNKFFWVRNIQWVSIYGVVETCIAVKRKI
jgi:hypothetical protein